jgi:hypothetical protein
MDEQMQKLMHEYAEQAKRQGELAAKLLEGDPRLGYTAYIIAGDMLSAERATEMVNAGEVTVEGALPMIGSYARFDWAVKHIRTPRIFELLPELWSGSDPSDIDQDNLILWGLAWAYNDHKTICDGSPLPDGDLKVYRGQVNGDPIGISWTLDKIIAEQFSKTGGLRHQVQNGIVLSGKIHSSQVMGYLTRRGESEVILDPLPWLLESVKKKGVVFSEAIA